MTLTTSGHSPGRNHRALRAHPALALLAPCLLALTLTACGGGNDSGVNPTPAPVPAPVNSAPTADAGSTQSVVTGSTVTLDGTKSSDADGDALTYVWTLSSKPAGSTATLIGSTSSQPTFVADVTGDYEATLVVSDGKSNSAPVTVTITAGTFVGFDSLTSLPPGPSSLAFYSYNSPWFGDHIKLADGSPRTLSSVSIAMVSWTCQTGGASTNDCVSTPGATFDQPVTLNVYDSSNTLITTQTQTFAILYRPSADPTCVDTNGNPTGKWKASDGSCYNGISSKITFDLASLKLALPDDLLYYQVAINTKTAGNPPTGQNGPYDSLNIALSGSLTPSAGSYPVPGEVIVGGGTWVGPQDYSPDFGGLGAQVEMMAP